ncbi:MAG TPA: ABC transporter substrate binding protein [Bryobacteraceae bacterium]|nr:ABC transporter substrate binding protein [Bryobacteraceae bacterium]
MVQRILFPALLWCGSALSAVEPGRITVVYSSEAQPYMEALDGLRYALPNSHFAAVDLHSSNFRAQLANSVEASSNGLIVTIGRDALEAVGARKGDMPLLATMIMQSELAGKQHVTEAVRLDIPLAGILGELRAMFPHKNRVAVLRNPALPGQVDAAAVSRARQQGFAVQVIDAAGPEESLRVLRYLKGRADFAVCLPDSALYNSATVKALILASLESQLPIVGFSQSFVRAGAAIGVYPDFRDIGLQTGEIAQKHLAGQAATPVDGPRKLVVGVNPRVMRLLGLEYREGGDVVTVR